MTRLKRVLGVVVCCASLPLAAATPSRAPQQPAGPIPTGTVCLPPVDDPTPGEKSLANDTGGNPPPDYSVQFGEGAIVPLVHSPRGVGPGILVVGMPLDRSYMVRVRHQGRLIESFVLRFAADDKGRQCLSLAPLYLTWRLWSPDMWPPCRCRDAKAMPWKR